MLCNFCDNIHFFVAFDTRKGPGAFCVIEGIYLEFSATLVKALASVNLQ